MNIAVIAPANFPIRTDRKYGGIERIIASTVLGFCQKGHSVTLYAPDGTNMSHPQLHLVTMPHDIPTPEAERALFDRIKQDAAQYDVIHSHLEPIIAYINGSNMLTSIKTPIVATIHNQTYIDDHVAYYAHARDIWNITFVFISKSQAKPLTFLPKQHVVYNGIDIDEFEFSSHANQSQLVFLGRITPEKGLKEAILIARAARMNLVIGAALHKSQHAYFTDQIEPMIDNKTIRYIGEPDDITRQQILDSSIACLLPLKWPEPFGLTVVESLACGTPVIAPALGALPEIVEDGTSGFLVDPNDLVAGSVDALQHIARIDRAACRRTAERFNTANMVAGYLSLFEQVVANKRA